MTTDTVTAQIEADAAFAREVQARIEWSREGALLDGQLVARCAADGLSTEYVGPIEHVPAREAEGRTIVCTEGAVNYLRVRAVHVGDDITPAMRAMPMMTDVKLPAPGQVQLRSWGDHVYNVAADRPVPVMPRDAELAFGDFDANNAELYLANYEMRG